MNSVKALFVTCFILITGSQAFATNEYYFKYSNFYKRPYYAEVEVIHSSDQVITKDYVSGVVFYDFNRDGIHDFFEPGLPNVMVSNGFDVVKTNHRGQYRLPAASRGLQDFTVFITKPAGWKLPVDEDNIPQFSYHHMPYGSPDLRFGGLPATGPQPEAINFPLVRDRYKNNFKIAVSGDTQPYSNNEVGYVRDSLANELAARKDLEFLIIEGDVMGDDLGLYPRFKKILSAAKVPVYFVPGNHDLDFDAKSDANSFDTFKREFGPTYYSFDIGEVHFVVLDNVRYPCTPELDNVDGKHDFCNDPENRPTYNGVIDEAQMEWLANDLANVPEHKLIVLNLHIPIVTFTDMYATKHQTDNAQWLYDLIGDRPAVSLTGHTHTLENFLPGEYYEGWQESLGLGATPFPQIVTGASSGSWWSGDLDEYNLPMSIQRLGAPRGYLILEFFGNEFTSTFKAANKSKTEQMSMDFLSPTFISWFDTMMEWKNTDPTSRSETPPVSIADLPDTSILTTADLLGGTQLVVNVWNGSQESIVSVKIDDREAVFAQNVQQGQGEGKTLALDPFALKKQLYVYRYATKSESGNERTQGFELFKGSKFGTADPQPLDTWMLTQSSTHIWTIDMPEDLEPGIHTLKVSTKDRFGKRYKMTKTFEVMDQRPAPYFRKELFE